jgi:hypothetical protein
MPLGQNSGDSPTGLTVDSAAKAIEGLLSDSSEKEKPADVATPEKPAGEQVTPEPETSEESNDEGEAAEPASEEESEGAEEPAAPAKQPPKHKVKIDGQDAEVTLEEALAGYSRTQDYTRKTQTLAEEKKTFLAEQTAIRAARQQYTEKLTQLDAALAALTQEPDWDKLRTEDPNVFAQTHAAWQINQQKINALRAEHAREAQALQTEQAEAFHQHLLAEQAKLFEAVPEWKDEAVSKKERAALLTYGQERGFSADEIGQVADHRALVILRKAMLYDQAQADAAKAKPKAQEKIDAVKTAAPGPSSASKPKVTEMTRRKQRLAKTGSVDDAASAIELMLGE